MKTYAVSVEASDWIDVDANSEAEALERAKDIFSNCVHDRVEATVMHESPLDEEEV